MAEAVQQDSITQTTLSREESYSYYSGRLFKVLKGAAICSLPFVPLQPLAHGLITNAFAQSLYNDPIDEEDAEDFVITKRSIEPITDLYMNRLVKVSGEGASEVKAAIRARMVQTLNENLELVSQIAKQMNLTSPLLSYRIPMTLSSVGHMAEGKGGSIPVVRRTASPIIIKLSSKEDAAKAIDAINKASYDIGKFIITHELIHLQRNHIYYKLALLTAVCALNCFMWVSGYNGTATWARFFVATFLKTLPIQLMTKLFSNIIDHKFEKEADIGAMDSLVSNKGAIELFQGQVKAGIIGDAIHPPNKERLAYALKWKAPC